MGIGKAAALRRVILVVLDGLGDHGHAMLQGRTPLMAAQTPNLDRLASLGMNGLYHAHRQGVALPSEIAHFLMFGYDLAEFPGRGYLEALGADLPVADNDVALLGRLFCVREEAGRLILTVEDPQVDADSCRQLQWQIQHFQAHGVDVEFMPTKGIQGIVRLRGLVSPDITDSNPIQEGRPLMQVLPLAGREADPAVQQTCRVLNDYLIWTHRVLSQHPVNRRRQARGLPPLNAVGLQRPGRYKPIQPFGEKWGLCPLALATGLLYQGLSRHLGMMLLPVSDSANPEVDLRQRLQLAWGLTDFDFVYVHTKAPDVAAHTKDPRHKQLIISRLDRAFTFALQAIVPDPNLLLVITADHSTNSAGAMIHSGEAVPLTMVGAFTRRDGVSRFDEVSCAAGALSLVRGDELMYLILNFLDRGKLFGLRDAPVDQPYTPGPATPLLLT
ncbi:MAG: alkaline phosphatase family protein [Desulfobacca sp.]|uniref:alkaline phosphatase family protein n=1 Tax=Desulfobacca sp. TaxID=2067990 RepID=UPI004048F40A